MKPETKQTEQEDMAAFEIVIKTLLALPKESQQRIIKSAAVFFKITI